ncbi:Uncharacterized conserved protein, NAD-dependent epimerase/dehydratase family [Parapedobacter composti]|uniref:Uncharacterized conserved protein, NAD-dependent epimerase/dehydratase family n=1 Tax=Parapedobacter composti TaxID=623281 RepID=A0A1I1KKK9_9SPHI|nr:DUF1611 domain-containing protein [Parapedobacter composti]SFC59208.1 Uncharacterized conserved protein, NAD-dependent epimerase/dehydratase family [Parapedobacter composti]
METAIILTAGLLSTGDAKTAHGLIRESGRYRIVGVVDHQHAGSDAGEVLDGRSRGIPVVSNMEEALLMAPRWCIVGVATLGGKFPDSMLADVRIALERGVSVVNGLHDFLVDRPDMVALAAASNARIIDIRKPKPFGALHFWTGEINRINTPVVAVIGTDCSLGKRTTSKLMVRIAAAAGIHAEMIYTGQTGWLQGGKYGFIFDSTLNDFVSGELEHAIVQCVREENPDLVLLEGQSALRNPSGPAGAELLRSGGAKHVVLVHAPKRKYYEHNPEWGEIPSLASEIELIAAYGAQVVGIAINTEGCTAAEAADFQQHYQQQFGIPVSLPLTDGCGPLLPVLQALTGKPVGV